MILDKWTKQEPSWWTQDNAQGFVIIDTCYGRENIKRELHLVTVRQIINGYMRTAGNIFMFDMDPVVYYSVEPVTFQIEE